VKRMTFSIFVIFMMFTCFFSSSVLANGNVGVTYQGHVQNIGWQAWVADGQMAGTQGQSLRMEALKVNLTNAPAGASIKYEAHVQNIGWQSLMSNSQVAGTTGQSLRMEAIKITLENLPGYSVEYRGHVQNIGWMPWVKDGEMAGTTGQSLRMEGIEIHLAYDPMTAISVVGSVSGSKITATIQGITDPNGIKMIQVPIWSDVNGQVDLIWYTATAQSDGSYSVTIDIRNHNYDVGVYNIHVYGTDNNGNMTMLGKTMVEVKTATPIMGTTTVSAQQLVDYYNDIGFAFPQEYIDLGVNLETFVNMYIQESAAESVRAEVAFAQVMLETGHLQFGGDVKVGQFNFAGLGATGGVPGFDFAKVYGNNRVGIQTGIRAHIQHLKCYASDLSLNKVNVDPRWGDQLRLRATTIEGLAETWSTDQQYATKILNIMNRF